MGLRLRAKTPVRTSTAACLARTDSRLRSRQLAGGEHRDRESQDHERIARDHALDCRLAAADGKKPLQPVSACEKKQKHDRRQRENPRVDWLLPLVVLSAHRLPPSGASMDNAEAIAFVTPLERALEPRLLAAIDAKAKPQGSLGRIEALAVHIGLVTKSLKPNLGRAALLVFAGDHGIVAEGVTAYPSEVSTLIAQMVLDGKAGASIAAQAAGAEVFLIDAGLKTPPQPHKALIAKSVRRSTRDCLLEPAMTESECRGAIQAGHDVATRLKG